MLGAGDEPDRIVPLPLRHTAVQARVAGSVAPNEVRQTFHKPFSGRIEAFASTSHVIETTCPSADRRRVELGALDRIQNRDFVLRYRVAGERMIWIW